jgi:ABC-type multidrug transport system permease subunit
MKNKIEYILAKLVQITAIFYLPVLLYGISSGPFSFGTAFRFGLDFALLIYFIEELLSKELEKRLHGELN